jgi:hypothetical protein
MPCRYPTSLRIEPTSPRVGTDRSALDREVTTVRLRTRGLVLAAALGAGVVGAGCGDDDADDAPPDVENQEEVDAGDPGSSSSSTAGSGGAGTGGSGTQGNVEPDNPDDTPMTQDTAQGDAG